MADSSVHDAGYFKDGHPNISTDLIENIESPIQRTPTAGSVVMTSELFQKLYLSPQNQVKGELRRTFANPTPVYDMCTPELSLSSSGF
jgi:hypothetical protein